MKNNVFQFGDTYWLQLVGTAMGTPPAPTYANLVFALHENTVVPKYSSNLLLYKRYIDDIFGIWHHHGTVEEDKARWTSFQSDIGSYEGLDWIFSKRVQSLDYLDIVISITGSRLKTTLFEKELNLYLYIPPHSAHPPGVLRGLVLGNCHRIYTLCSEPEDITALLRMFYYRLLARGYSPSNLLPLFDCAYHLAYERKNNPAQTLPLRKEEDDIELLRSRIFFHTKYHPTNPPIIHTSAIMDIQHYCPAIRFQSINRKESTWWKHRPQTDDCCLFSPS